MPRSAPLCKRSLLTKLGLHTRWLDRTTLNFERTARRGWWFSSKVHHIIPKTPSSHQTFDVAEAVTLRAFNATVRAAVQTEFTNKTWIAHKMAGSNHLKFRENCPARLVVSHMVHMVEARTTRISRTSTQSSVHAADRHE